MIGRVALGALAIALAGPAIAQPQAAPAPSPFALTTTGAAPAAPADVASIEAIMAAVYDVISGPAGQRRDWDRMRSLFVADARMMPKGRTGLRSGGVEAYIAANGALLEERGFFERELARTVEQYGDIAQVFSTYEARETADGPVIARGINSIQLVRQAERWWVVSIMWQQETPDNPIPGRYLSPSNASERG